MKRKLAEIAGLLLLCALVVMASIVVASAHSTASAATPALVNAVSSLASSLH